MMKPFFNIRLIFNSIIFLGTFSKIAISKPIHYLTLTCELKTDNNEQKSIVELTDFNNNLGQTLESALINEQPMLLQVYIDNKISTPTNFIVDSFGFEPGMYIATTQITFDTSTWSFKLIYDSWARPITTLEMTIGDTVLKGSCMEKSKI